jgi:hypothetical protein
MKKFSLIAFASLIALSSAAQAQSFDLNSMPLGNVPQKLDSAETGSIAAKKVFVRTIDRDGTTVTQRYTVANDGAVTIISEQAE